MAPIPRPLPLAERRTLAERQPWLRIVLPVAVLVLSVGLWEAICRLQAIPPFILPSPSVIGQTLLDDRVLLAEGLLVTLRTTAIALVLAIAGGVALAILLTRSALIELTFAPYAVILQVTPIIAIAPILLIYLEVGTATIVCAWLVAFFPILSNTVTGLRSADHHLRDLFELYGAGRMQTLARLQIPSALPYFAAGLRIGGGLSLIGAVVGEIAAGTVGRGSGLAARIIESFYRLNIPRAYAALVLISLTGILIYALTSLAAHLLLRRWHDSALARER